MTHNPMLLACEWPTHAEDETTCGGGAVVSVTVYEDDGQPWEWETQRLCASAWASLRDGFLFYPYGLTVNDAEVVVRTIFDPETDEDYGERMLATTVHACDRCDRQLAQPGEILCPGCQHPCEYTDNGNDPNPEHPACGKPSVVCNPHGKSGKGDTWFDYDEWFCARHAAPAWLA